MEHLNRLQQVFKRTSDNGLNISPKKFNIVSEHEVEPDTDKIASVKNWPVPQNAEEVRQFSGFAEYYRQFIHDFSKISITFIRNHGHRKKSRKWIQSGGGRRNRILDLTSFSRNVHHHLSYVTQTLANLEHSIQMHARQD